MASKKKKSSSKKSPASKKKPAASKKKPVIKKAKKAKKASPKKAVPKKQASKKAVPKKQASKKASPKKASPKKAASKKAVPKKQASKKAAPKKQPPAPAVSKQAKPLKTKKASGVSSSEKRKILELKKELENLSKDDVVPIKDAEGRFYCQDESCDQPAVTDVYCRYHYLALWKYLKIREKLLAENYLSKTLEELTKSMGEGTLHFLLRDFKTEKSFETVAKEMNLKSGKEEDMSLIETDTESLL